jgi:hypothetical protein
MVYWFNVRVGLCAVFESPVFQISVVQRVTAVTAGLSTSPAKICNVVLKIGPIPRHAYKIRDQRLWSVPLLMGVVVLRHGVSAS